MKKQGEIKEVRSLIINNQHVQWNEMFKFIIKIDQDEGIVLSKRNEYPLSIGEKVSYEYTPAKEGQKYGKIKGVTRLENKKEDGGGKTYNNPDVVRYISYGMCQSIVINMLINTEETISTFDEVDVRTKEFYNWVIMEGLDRDICSRRYYALKDAVESLKIKGVRGTLIKGRNDIILCAEKLYNDLVVATTPEKEEEQSIPDDGGY